MPLWARWNGVPVSPRVFDPTAANVSSAILPVKQPSLGENLREFWAYRELLWVFVQRELKVRYKNSVLGFAWSLLNPLVQVLTLSAVILFLMPQEQRPQNYHAYVFCATLPWLFFSTALMDSTNSLLAYHSLLRKTYFPREILPLTLVITNLIHFLLSTGALFLYLTLNALFWWIRGNPFDLALEPTVVLLPIPIFGLTLLVTGCSLFLCVWNLYFEDVRFILDSALKILYWLVPVIYFGDAVLRRLGEAPYTLYMLNPLSSLISAFRKLVLPPTRILGVEGPGAITQPMVAQDWLFLGIALLTSAALAAAGLSYFNSRKWKLAERA